MNRRSDLPDRLLEAFLFLHPEHRLGNFFLHPFPHRVDVVATVSPTQQPTDMTSKVILTNVQVLASGTKIERDTEKNKPIAVTVVTLLVDPMSVQYLMGAEIDYREDLSGAQFIIRNPNASTTCGCGSSYSV